MSKLKFIPGVDGVRPEPYRQHLRRLPLRATRRTLELASVRVLQSLKATYFGAVEIYNLAKHHTGWLQNPEIEELSFTSGLIFVILDYFYAGLYLPRDIEKLPRVRRRSFEQYFWERSSDNLRVNNQALLEALSIATLLPDEWYPEVVLERQIKHELNKLRVFREVQIHADLGLEPGGLAWLGQATSRSLARLLEQAAGLNPRPVRLIRSPRLSANRQVIVYDLKQETESRFYLRLYEPGCVCVDHALLIEKRVDRPVILESCPPGPPTPIAGLLYDDYLVRTPPDNCLSPSQRADELRKIVWHWRRWRQ